MMGGANRAVCAFHTALVRSLAHLMSHFLGMSSSIRPSSSRLGYASTIFAAYRREWRK